MTADEYSAVFFLYNMGMKNILVLNTDDSKNEKLTRGICLALFGLISLVYVFMNSRLEDRTQSMIKALVLLLIAMVCFVLFSFVSSLIERKLDKSEEKKTLFSLFLEKEPFYHSLVFFLLLPIGVSYLGVTVSLVIALLLSEGTRILLKRETISPEVIALILLYLIFNNDFVPYLNESIYDASIDTYQLIDISTNEKLSSFLFCPLSFWENYLGYGFSSLGSKNFLMITILGLYLSLTRKLNGKQIVISILSYYLGLAVLFLGMQDGMWAFPDSLRLFFFSDFAFLAVFVLSKQKDENHSYLIFALHFSLLSLLFLMLTKNAMAPFYSLLIVECVKVGYSYLGEFKERKAFVIPCISVLLILIILLPLLIGIQHPMDSSIGSYL